RTTTLDAARTEVQGLSVVLRSPTGATVRGVSVEPPRNDAGQTVPATAFRIYRVATLSVTTPSNLEGRKGEYPDALIPVVDAYAHEARRAFPVSLPAARSLAIYLEARIPAEQARGHYHGDLV